MPQRVAAHDQAGLAAAAARAATAWRAGGLVAFPTETVYGLGAAARLPEAVARVFLAKGRPADHPLIVHLADAAALEDWVEELPAAGRRLAAAFWPGPLTLVLRKAAWVPAAVTGGQATLAVRVPDHPVARALLRAFGDGVAAPSANRFGRVSPTTAAHVLEDLAHVEDLLVVDGGPCQVGIESTIVDLSGARPRLLRPGGVTRAALEERLGAPLAVACSAARTRADEVRVPGSLPRHYAPDTPTRRVAAGAGDSAPAEVAVLALRPAPADRCGPWGRLPDDPVEAGRALYRVLRELDGTGASELWLEEVPDAPAWAAVADRLARAAAPAIEEGT